MGKFIFFITFLLEFLLFPGAAWAQYDKAIYNKGNSTFTATGVICTTGTSVQLNSTRQVPGFNLAGYRLRNNDSADQVHIGHNISVSTFTDNAVARAQYGEPLTTGSSATWEVGLNPDLANQPPVEIWCRAVDAAGAAGALISVVSWGYK